MGIWFPGCFWVFWVFFGVFRVLCCVIDEFYGIFVRYVTLLRCWGDFRGILGLFWLILDFGVSWVLSWVLCGFE